MKRFICSLVGLFFTMTATWAGEVVPAIPTTVPVVGEAKDSRAINPTATSSPPQKNGREKNRRKEEIEKLKTQLKTLEAAQDREVVHGQLKGTIQRPVNAATVESKIIYDYVPNSIYLVYCAPKHMVDIQLQPGERLTAKPAAGDTAGWVVGSVDEGAGGETTTHVLIKPYHADVETNMLLVTDRHAYRLYLKSSNFFIPTIGWNYPEEEMQKNVALKTEQRRYDDQNVTLAVDATKINFKYKIKAEGNYSWTPVRVFDDGAKTYIQMSPEMKHNESPAFFVKNGKELDLVNFRIKGDYYIVDRLFEEGELRAGKHDKVRIIKEKRGWWGSSSPGFRERGKNPSEPTG